MREVDLKELLGRLEKTFGKKAVKELRNMTLCAECDDLTEVLLNKLSD